MKNLTKQQIENIVNEILVNECYDIQDEFTNEELAAAIVPFLSQSDTHKFKIGSIQCELFNGDGSLLTVFDGYSSDYSRCEVPIPIGKIKESELVKYFIDMLNEAWYNL